MSPIHRDFVYKDHRVVIEDSVRFGGFMVWVAGLPVGVWETEPLASAAGYEAVERMIADEAVRSELEELVATRGWVTGPPFDPSLGVGAVVWISNRGQWHRGRVEAVAEVQATVVFLTKKGGKLKRVRRRFEHLVAMPT